jgi:hypothetical protein
MGGGLARWAIVGAAFVAGAAVAAVVAYFVLRDGDGGDGPKATATPAGTATETPTAGPTATPTAIAGATTEAALGALAQAEVQQPYGGPCPEQLAPGEQPPAGVCSLELYRSEELATFVLSAGSGGNVGEAVLTPAEGGGWSAVFVPVPPVGELQVGAMAVVYLAGDCVNFRNMPSINSNPPASCQIDGTTGPVAEGPVDADGYRWYRIEGYGWATDEYLAAVP